MREVRCLRSTARSVGARRASAGIATRFQTCPTQRRRFWRSDQVPNFPHGPLEWTPQATVLGGTTRSGTKRLTSSPCIAPGSNANWYLHRRVLRCGLAARPAIALLFGLALAPLFGRLVSQARPDQWPSLPGCADHVFPTARIVTIASAENNRRFRSALTAVGGQLGRIGDLASMRRGRSLHRLDVLRVR